VIIPSDFPGVDEDAARRIIVAAVRIAPCLHSFPDESEEKKNALAILRGIAAEAPKPGMRRVRSQSVAGASVNYWDSATWSVEDREDLRSLCPAATASVVPMGVFPKPSRHVAAAWPEDC